MLRQCFAMIKAPSHLLLVVLKAVTHLDRIHPVLPCIFVFHQNFSGLVKSRPSHCRLVFCDQLMSENPAALFFIETNYCRSELTKAEKFYISSKNYTIINFILLYWATRHIIIMKHENVNKKPSGNTLDIYISVAVAIHFPYLLVRPSIFPQG